MYKYYKMSAQNPIFLTNVLGSEVEIQAREGAWTQGLGYMVRIRGDSWGFMGRVNGQGQPQPSTMGFRMVAGGDLSAVGSDNLLDNGQP